MRIVLFDGHSRGQLDVGTLEELEDLQKELKILKRTADAKDLLALSPLLAALLGEIRALGSDSLRQWHISTRFRHHKLPKTAANLPISLTSIPVELNLSDTLKKYLPGSAFFIFY
jgi:hypothetical protein